MFCYAHKFCYCRGPNPPQNSRGDPVHSRPNRGRVACYTRHGICEARKKVLKKQRFFDQSGPGGVDGLPVQATSPRLQGNPSTPPGSLTGNPSLPAGRVACKRAWRARRVACTRPRSKRAQNPPDSTGVTLSTPGLHPARHLRGSKSIHKTTVF